MSVHNKRKKILFIQPTLTFFGSEQSLLFLLEKLDKKRYSPIVAVPLECEFSNIFCEAGVEVFKFDFLKLRGRMTFKKIFEIVMLNFALLKSVQEKKIDLVHINLTTEIKKMTIFHLFLNKPYVIHLRWHHYFDSIDRLITMRSSRFICVSEDIKKFFLKKRKFKFIILDYPQRVITIYNGRNEIPPFDSNVLKRNKEAFGIHDHKVIGMIGAIIPRKNQTFFLEIAAELKKYCSNFKILIVGDVYEKNEKLLKYKENLFKLCRKLELEKYVVFTGHRKDVPLILQMLDVLVAVSTREALGGQVIEAMMAAKSVVASNVDGFKELVANGETGYLIDSWNPQSYAEKISYLLRNDKVNREMGSEGRKRAMELFDIKKCVANIENIYEELLNHHN